MSTIHIRKAEGTWVVRSGGAILGETQNALELSRNDQDPVIYFPKGDIAMVLLDRSEKTTADQELGQANFFSIVNKSSTAENAAWTHETPTDLAARLSDHIAFVTSDSVKVEKI